MDELACAEAAGDGQRRHQLAPESAEAVWLLGDRDDGGIGGHQVPEPKAEALSRPQYAVKDRDPLRTMQLPQLVFRTVDLLMHGQQPCEVRVQRLLRDSQERGLEPQYAFLDTGQAGPRISPRLDASEISKAGLPPAAFYQQMAREHRNRVLTLDVRRRLMAHERNLPAVA